MTDDRNKQGAAKGETGSVRDTARRERVRSERSSDGHGAPGVVQPGAQPFGAAKGDGYERGGTAVAGAKERRSDAGRLSAEAQERRRPGRTADGAKQPGAPDGAAAEKRSPQRGYGAAATAAAKALRGGAGTPSPEAQPGSGRAGRPPIPPGKPGAQPHGRNATPPAGQRRSGDKRSRSPGDSGNGLRAAVASPAADEVRPGQRIVVTIKRIGINGEGVGYFKRKAVFVDGALPDEVVKADVIKAEPGYINARLAEIEKPSPHRQEPACPVYASCGGCQLQHMAYPAQLAAKEELVREAFRRYAGLEDAPIRPILGMDEPWGYRNKAQLQLGRTGSKVLAGLYSPGTHRLVDISGCPIHDPALNRVMDEVKRLLHELDVPIYDERTRQGDIRTVVARIGRAEGKLQLTFVTAGERLPQKDRLIRLLRARLPELATIAQNINSGRSPLVFGERTIILWGDERLNETLGDVRFALSPRAFFQLNPVQTVKLYDVVKEAAALTGRELVVDAYCGTGTIGLWLAPFAREVRGIEIVPEAVEDARDNARASGVTNARFEVGQAERLLPEWVRGGARPDVVVVDPPRTGCGRELLDALAEAKPARLVYVSCNPSTLAKDCRRLLEQGYRLEWIQPVDMFPQTSHVESVILMARKGA